MSARPLFVGGTASHAGKSWMATALCAWLRRRGVRVAPFKAQNMSNNSFPCVGGGEIGRAQVAQAEACGLQPEPAMNPILLKPNGDGTSQVVVNGRVWKTLAARDYYACAAELRGIVRSAYEDLAGRFDVVIIEGAGSVTELNLRPYDLVNLDLVTRLEAPWMLVADIERGGVFGSVVGTFDLLTTDERRLCRGFAINRFRGDASLFEDGVRLIEARTGAPCLGVFPHAPDIHLDAEDSLSTGTRPQSAAPDRTALAIIRLPSMSNTTDFRLLTWADWVSAPPAADYDFIVLPGSKQVIADLEWLHASGLGRWIQAQHRRGATIVGICGGYQMLGRSIGDPAGAESPRSRASGLNLIPADTVLGREKTTRVVTATTARGVSFGAYEIHLGETTVDRDAGLEPFARLDTGAPDGARAARVIGTYLHGALEHPAVCAEVFGVPLSAMPSAERDYDRLADWFAANARDPESLGLDRQEREDY
jgi:adenosylcobyric acid synthase